MSNPPHVVIVNASDAAQISASPAAAQLPRLLDRALAAIYDQAIRGKRNARICVNEKHISGEGDEKLALMLEEHLRSRGFRVAQEQATVWIHLTIEW